MTRPFLYLLPDGTLTSGGIIKHELTCIESGIERVAVDGFARDIDESLNIDPPLRQKNLQIKTQSGGSTASLKQA